VWYFTCSDCGILPVLTVVFSFFFILHHKRVKTLMIFTGDQNIYVINMLELNLILKGYCLPAAIFFHTQNYCRLPY
jgi:hypothetical protein